MKRQEPKCRFAVYGPHPEISKCSGILWEMKGNNKGVFDCEYHAKIIAFYAYCKSSNPKNRPLYNFLNGMTLDEMDDFIRDAQAFDITPYYQLPNYLRWESEKQP